MPTLPDCNKEQVVDQKLRNHWDSQLRALFRKDAEFSVVELPGRYEVAVSWRINTDPERPNKRSKTIRIVVPEETIDDYENKSDTVRAQDDEKLKQFIAGSLKKFDPNHDAPKDMPCPEVKWVAGSNVLNS